MFKFKKTDRRIIGNDEGFATCWWCRVTFHPRGTVLGRSGFWPGGCANLRWEVGSTKMFFPRAPENAITKFP